MTEWAWFTWDPYRALAGACTGGKPRATMVLPVGAAGASALAHRNRENEMPTMRDLLDADPETPTEATAAAAEAAPVAEAAATDPATNLRAPRRTKATVAPPEAPEEPEPTPEPEVDPLDALLGGVTRTDPRWLGTPAGRQHVLEVSVRYAKEHSLCAVVDKALMEIGFSADEIAHAKPPQEGYIQVNVPFSFRPTGRYAPDAEGIRWDAVSEAQRGEIMTAMNALRDVIFATMKRQNRSWETALEGGEIGDASPRRRPDVATYFRR